MGKFVCSACGKEGKFIYDPPRHECPYCGSNDVLFALGIDEIPDEFLEALTQAEQLDDLPDEEDR